MVNKATVKNEQIEWHFNTKFISDRFIDTASINLHFKHYPHKKDINVCIYAYELYLNVLDSMGLYPGLLPHLDHNSEEHFSKKDNILTIFFNGALRRFIYPIIFFNLLDRLCENVNEVVYSEIYPKQDVLATIVYPDIEDQINFPYSFNITDRNVNFYIFFGNIVGHNEKQKIDEYLFNLFIAGTIGGFKYFQQKSEHSSLIMPEYLEWSPSELYFEIQKTSVCEAFFDCILLVLEKINKKVVQVINVEIE